MPVELEQQLTIPEAIATLKRTASPPDGVLSAFLMTSPDRARGRSYLLSCRAACRGVRASLPASELATFDAAVERAEQYLAVASPPSSPGLAIYVAGDSSYFFAVPLPRPPTEHAVWGPRPEIEPLIAALDENERIAVLLFDKERARIFTVFLGEVEERQTIEDYVPGKQATGGWFALAQTRYARHHEEHVRRHVKRSLAATMEMLRKHSFDRLLLAGPDETLTTLRQQLPRPLRTRLAGTLQLELFASEADILQATREAAKNIEREEEARAVNELLEAAMSSRHAALDTDAVLTALNEGRVHVLFIADPLAVIGRECGRCGALARGDEPCPQCGASAVAAEGFREHIVEHALAQGARIEEVSGEAARTLLDHGGLGAWTRY